MKERESSDEPAFRPFTPIARPGEPLIINDPGGEFLSADALDDLKGRAKWPWGMTARSRIFAESTITYVYMGRGTQMEPRRRAATHIELLEIELLLRDYGLLHGRFPKDLASLGDRITPHLLVDRYSGKPLVYRSSDDECVVYSVGPDGEDNGGVAFGGRPGEDFGVRIKLTSGGSPVK